MKPGDRVKCTYRGAHRGTLLALDDPRAWAGTIAFPDTNPDPEAVRAHVEMHRASFERYEHRPVLWDFGRLYWDHKLQAADAPDQAAWYDAAAHLGL